MADEINLLTSFEFDKGGASLKRTAEQQKIDVSGDLYLETIASATSSGISVDKGDLATIGVARIKNLDATNYVRAGDDGTNYPLRINPGESFIMRLNGNALHLKSYVVAQVESFDVTGTGAVAQVETFTAVADVSDSLDGKYIQLSDESGTVGFWIDTDDSGTSEPAGSAALTRSVEVTTIATDDTALVVAAKMATAINADSKFSATVSGSVVTVTHATEGDVADGEDGAQTTGFTDFTVTTNGADQGVLDGTYIQLSDDAGTVGFWIDVGDTGTAEPSGSAALTRSVEITTVTDTMDDDTLATTIAAAINGDADYSASASGSVVTVTHANTGAMGDAQDGDQPTGFSSFTVVTNGEDPTVEVQVSMVEE
jgi:hypothetical protein